ncbi:hypothetical protein VC279_22575 [Xanthomonas sp. WHRI 10064A]|uniref:hypothetical protein n=1 Tax=unclassified Xanthomonas TaxID=2643310 RepID=UPI002B22BED2|nr:MULTISPECIES: hypothetical protein [unclassified Xanthomonas]MEA9589735.1 hypothetical protein [Xanthomonas sp. WHRI 10064B]MEA9617379.1 hypothetical protein [Xanthomonas sp. WHRI 10064A]
MKIDEIAYFFFRYAEEQGKPYKDLPMGTGVEEFGAPYIEINESGVIAIVAKDRGNECLRKETDSPEVLAKWIYEIYNK